MFEQTGYVDSFLLIGSTFLYTTCDIYFYIS